MPEGWQYLQCQHAREPRRSAPLRFLALRLAPNLTLAVSLAVGIVGQIPTADAASFSGRITTIDAKTRLVTATVTAGASLVPGGPRTFSFVQFEVGDAKVLSSLRRGQPVEADFQAYLVSISGIPFHYKIVSVSAGPTTVPSISSFSIFLYLHIPVFNVDVPLDPPIADRYFTSPEQDVNVNAKVILASPAPASGLILNLSGSNSAAADVPPT